MTLLLAPHQHMSSLRAGSRPTEDPGNRVSDPSVSFSGSSHQDLSTCCFFPQELSKLGLKGDMEVELRIFQLPVDYREVKQKVIRIWEDLKPQVNDGWRGSEAGGMGSGMMTWWSPRAYEHLDLGSRFVPQVRSQPIF